MANISITVYNNLYTIALDDDDWTGLTVNGVTIANVPGVGWTYTQRTQGMVSFVATANNCTNLNPDNYFDMRGDSNYTHSCSINYAVTGFPFALYGLLHNVKQRPTALPGPFPFSQGMMTGQFQHG